MSAGTICDGYYMYRLWGLAYMSIVFLLVFARLIIVAVRLSLMTLHVFAEVDVA